MNTWSCFLLGEDCSRVPPSPAAGSWPWSLQPLGFTVGYQSKSGFSNLMSVIKVIFWPPSATLCFIAQLFQNSSKVDGMLFTQSLPEGITLVRMFHDLVAAPVLASVTSGCKPSSRACPLLSKEGWCGRDGQLFLNITPSFLYF